MMGCCLAVSYARMSEAVTVTEEMLDGSALTRAKASSVGSMCRQAPPQHHRLAVQTQACTELLRLKWTPHILLAVTAAPTPLPIQAQAALPLRAPLPLRTLLCHWGRLRRSQSSCASIHASQARHSAKRARRITPSSSDHSS
jgi:hypothetical protein